jgi:hypothetical protein
MLLILTGCLVAAATLAGGSPQHAHAGGFVEPASMQTALARWFPTATPVTPGPADPAVTIVRVDMLHRIGGIFSSTRQIRVGNIARYVVYFRERNAGDLLPRCHIMLFNRGLEIYEDAMWRKRGQAEFFLDGRFRNALGPSAADFTIYLGRATDTSSLIFTIRLPKF